MRRLLIPVLLCLLLCSCGYTVTDTESLLHPPTLNKQQQDVYAALESTLNLQDIVYKYPQRGDYRTPFIFYDLDGEGLEEAIVFYAMASDQSNTRIMVLRQDERDVWTIAHDHTLGSDQVDFVEFAHLLSTDSACMIVGWQNTPTTGGRGMESALSVFSLAGDAFTPEVRGQSYIDYITHDFDDDGLDELVAIERTENRTLRISLLRSVGRHIDVTVSLPLCYDADILLQTATGRLWDESGAVYIDEILIDTSYATEIIQVDSEGMTILAGGNNVSTNDEIYDAWEFYTFTFRDDPVPSRDYDGDGVVEVPFLKALPGTQFDEEESLLWLTELMELTPEGFEVSGRAVINEDEQYLVFYPDKWMNADQRESLVTVIRDVESGEWRFFLVDPETGESTSELLRISTENGMSQGSAGGYVELGSRGTRHYYGYIPLSSGEPAAITESELRGMFRLFG